METIQDVVVKSPQPPQPLHASIDANYRANGFHRKSSNVENISSLELLVVKNKPATTQPHNS
jgi:hypothetical protein